MAYRSFCHLKAHCGFALMVHFLSVAGSFRESPISSAKGPANGGLVGQPLLPPSAVPYRDERADSER
jgi:hypothetical protein